MLQVLDAAAIRRWVDVSVAVIERQRDELNRANVYPVADGDTGTNLALTLRAAAEALHRAPEAAEAAEVAAALAGGAVRGARGNSGVIISQLPRGLAEVLAGEGRGSGAAVLAAALRRADELAVAAVSKPVEGTILTVLRAAADAAQAAAAPGAGLPEVARAAARDAAKALADTPRLLPVLARAGVVDAGGQGLLLLLEALVSVVTGEPLARATTGDQGNGQRFRPRDPAALVSVRETGSAEFDYEVMYLLADSSPERVAVLRERLDELGDSVAVVGDGADVWRVHVHCGDVGAAIEAGIEAGRPFRITVVRFADQVPERTDRFTRERAVVAVVGGKQIAEVVQADDGVVALVATADHVPNAAELAASVAETRARHVVVLPNDVDLTPVAERAAELARASGTDVVVVPTSSVLQGLAALAVHDPVRRAGDDVVAMAEAAAATRTGVIRIADREALTWVGRCYPGDVLGLVDGEVVLIERDLTVAACQLADRMLTTGGELVTVLLAEELPPGAERLGEVLSGHLRRTHPEVEVVSYSGGPAGSVLQLGVE